jgi:hypothetical protein
MIASEEEKQLNASKGLTHATNDHAPPSRLDAAGQITGASGEKDRGARFWIIMGALMLAFVFSALDGAVVSTALPTIVHDFNIGASYEQALYHITLDDLQWSILPIDDPYPHAHHQVVCTQRKTIIPPHRRILVRCP